MSSRNRIRWHQIKTRWHFFFLVDRSKRGRIRWNKYPMKNTEFKRANKIFLTGHWNKSPPTRVVLCTFRELAAIFFVRCWVRAVRAYFPFPFSSSSRTVKLSKYLTRPSMADIFSSAQRLLFCLGRDLTILESGIAPETSHPASPRPASFYLIFIDVRRREKRCVLLLLLLLLLASLRPPYTCWSVWLGGRGRSANQWLLSASPSAGYTRVFTSSPYRVFLLFSF